jgi:hypothetical protein
MSRFGVRSIGLLLACGGTLLAKTACEILPIDDAVVVLSQNAQQRDLGAEGCIYEIQIPYLALTVTSPQDAAKSGFSDKKQAAKQTGATVKEEAGIGSASFSVVTKDAEALYVIQGTFAFSIALTNPGSSTPLPDLMSKMRDVARRAVSRL